jgi:outer membrane protein OmpU
LNNFKKIGLTALAGSLVATSVAYAGALEATGAAEMKMTNNSQSAAGKTVGMGNSVYLKGSGETDGGLNVSLSFELDQGVADGAAGVYDSHSVSVGNDAFGTVTVHAHGGSNSAAALDTTAAGDFWDNSLGIGTATGGAGDTPQSSTSGNGLVVYSLPSMVDGLSVGLSYASAGENVEGSTAFGLTYTGVEGLSVSYGQGESAGKVGTDMDQEIMKFSYAYGPLTFKASNNDFDHTTATNDQEVSSFAFAYSVTDSISVSYGEETIEKHGKAADIEIDGVTASYTSGGMTAALTSISAKNVDHTSTTASNDNDFWKVSLSFAF